MDIHMKMLLIMISKSMISLEQCQGVKTICLDKNSVKISNPFPDIAEGDQDILGVFWSRQTFLSTGLAPKEDLIEYNGTGWTIKQNRTKPYDTWGLQLNEANSSDCGNYEVGMAHSNGPKNVYFLLATPPTIPAAGFSVDKTVLSDGRIELSCGEMITAGSPPVSLHWKDDEGKLVAATRTTSQSIYLTVEKGEDLTKYKCGINMSEAAASCIPDKSRQLWTDISYGEIRTTTPRSTTVKSTSSAPGMPSTAGSLILFTALVQTAA